MSNAYSFIACDLATRQVIDTLPLTGATVTWSLGDTGGDLSGPGLNMNINTGDPAEDRARVQQMKDASKPGRTIIYLAAGGALLGGWIVWRRTYDSSTRIATLTTEAIQSYWARRLIVVNSQWLGQDLFTILREVIGTAQAEANSVQLTMDDTILAGATTNLIYDASDLQTVLDAANGLADSDPQFDWTIIPRWGADGLPEHVLTAGYPHLGLRGSDTGLALEYPGNVLSYTSDENGGAGGLRTRTWGRCTTDEGVTIGAVSSSPDLTAGGYPVLEEQVQYSQALDTAALQAKTDAEQAKYAGVAVTPTFIVRADSDPLIGTYSPGDQMRVRITDPAWWPSTDQLHPGFDGTMTCSTISLDTSTDQVTITMGDTLADVD